MLIRIFSNLVCIHACVFHSIIDDKEIKITSLQKKNEVFIFFLIKSLKEDLMSDVIGGTLCNKDDII